MTNTPLDPKTIERMAQTMDDLHSVPILVLPDDDERFIGLDLGCVLSDGQRFYIPESAWPALRAALLKLRPDTALIPRSRP